MKPTLTEIKEAVLAGDRYTAHELLKEYLRHDNRDPEALWYIIHTTDDEDFRAQALDTLIAKTPDSAWRERAKRIREREEELEPPPSWSERQWERMKAHKGLIISVILVVFVFIPLAAILVVRERDQNEQERQQALSATATARVTPTPSATPTSTPFPRVSQYQARYDEGTLVVLRIERATQRPLQSDRTSDAATPAPPVGAEFVAIQFEFLCGTAQAICNEPPQGDISLRLANGSVVSYNTSNTVTVVGELMLGAVSASQGATISGWRVFEVPRGAGIDAVLLRPASYEYDDPRPPLEIRLNP
jgi:hypothetical protein